MIVTVVICASLIYDPRVDDIWCVLSLPFGRESNDNSIVYICGVHHGGVAWSVCVQCLLLNFAAKCCR
jgi:hypothetical protein